MESDTFCKLFTATTDLYLASSLFRVQDGSVREQTALQALDALMARIGVWLQDLRKRRGVSQAQLSKEIATRYGIHLEPSRYSQMERGKEGPPTLKTFLAMVDFFNADLSSLYTPDLRGQIAGLEFLYQNPELADELLQLRDNWGEAAAARYLIEVTRSANAMTDGDARVAPRTKGRTIRVARPRTEPTPPRPKGRKKKKKK